MALALGLVAFAAPAKVQAQQPKPSFEDAWAKGQDLFNLGRYDDARVQFEKARDLSPKLPGPWRYLGRLAKIQQRWDDCVSAATEAIRLKPDSDKAAEVREDLDVCRRALKRAPFAGVIPDKQGALAVTSNVEGARITVDGISKGGTPLAPVPLTPGKKKVVIEKAGYFMLELDVEVVVSIVVDVDAQLEVDPDAKVEIEKPLGPIGDDITVGWIVVAVDAPGAAVLIDGKVPALGPQGSLEATPGEHTLSVTAPDHEGYRRRIRVARGQKRTLTVKLKPTAEMRSQNRVGYVLFGVAAAAAASGVVFGFLENDAYEEARDAYELEKVRPGTADNLPSGLPESNVTTRAEYNELVDKADGYALISNISYGVAFVALGVSVYYFVKARPSERPGYAAPLADSGRKRPRLVPTFMAGGEGGVGAQLTFTQELDW